MIIFRNCPYVYVLLHDFRWLDMIHLFFSLIKRLPPDFPNRNGVFFHNFLISNHNPYDLFIGFLHAFFSKAAYIFQCLLHALGDNPVAAIELLASDVHIVAQDACVYRRGDLGRAGGLAPSQTMPDTMARALTTVWVTSL